MQALTARKSPPAYMIELSMVATAAVTSDLSWGYGKKTI